MYGQFIPSWVSTFSPHRTIGQLSDMPLTKPSTKRLGTRVHAYKASLVLLAPTLALAASLPPGSPPSVSEDDAIIITPTDGTSVTAGEPFAFSVRDAPGHSTICHEPWTTVNVYILANKPTTEDLNATYGFSDYLCYLGEYTIFNDGNITPPPGIPDVPVPPTLTAPDFGAAFSGLNIYLSVVEDLGECDPFEDVGNISLDSRDLVYTE